MAEDPRIVSVSLGSNGFHLHTLERSGDKFKPGSHLHQPVQIESYVGTDGAINEEGIRRTMAALQHFASHLEQYAIDGMGAIATGTFRKATNGGAVVAEAGQVLGYPVRIVSGMEESLLCYTGIANVEGISERNRLVIDVGGASTELIIARKNTLDQFHSIDIGCVSIANRFLPHADISQSGFMEAVDFAAESISRASEEIKNNGWAEVMGCGGTVSSLFNLLHRNRMAGSFLSHAALERFRLLITSDAEWRDMSEKIVGADRTRVLPAGAAVLLAVFRELGLERLKPVYSSVSQGLLVKIAMSVLQKSKE